jgi:Holliday junction DNA helicase RuvB
MSPIEPSSLSISVADNESKPKQSKNNLTKQKAQPEEIKLEPTLRPTDLQEYIGQERLKQILKISIEAALKRGDKASLGHLLLYGPPGLGKTSCAYLLAGLIGSNAHIFSAPALDKPKDIVGILMSLQEGDILFIDEIHRLNRITEELLYPAIEDFCLDLPTGQGISARVAKVPLPKFILIGATTKLGNISAPLRDRFTQIYRMEFYKPTELAEIAQRTSKLLNFNLSKEAAQVIASRARNTPRIVNRLCRLIRDFVSYQNKENADLDLVLEAFELFQIDELGLDPTDRDLLKILIENHGGGPVGLETLAVSLGEDARTLEDYYEPFLLKTGLLERTNKGRKVTDKALKHLGKDTD